jgi:hypothetical protein
MSKYHKAAWDDESRQRQREVIMKRKPWLKSTGAKTAEGKAISKMNALKISPELHLLMKDMKYLMRRQREICDIINHTKTL